MPPRNPGSERTGEVWDYRRKGGLLAEAIYAPKDAPAWSHDLQSLVNEIERVEKRGDAQLALNLDIALPHELTLEQNQRLIGDFVREEFSRHGYGAEITRRRDLDAERRTLAVLARFVDAQIIDLKAERERRRGPSQEPPPATAARPSGAPEIVPDRQSENEREGEIPTPQPVPENAPAATATRPILAQELETAKTNSPPDKCAELWKIRPPTQIEQKIRAAYAAAQGDRQTFDAALFKKGLALARVTATDVRAANSSVREVAGKAERGAVQPIAEAGKVIDRALGFVTRSLGALLKINPLDLFGLFDFGAGAAPSKEQAHQKARRGNLETLHAEATPSRG